MRHRFARFIIYAAARPATTARLVACGVWVLMAARRKQSAATTAAAAAANTANCQSHASPAENTQLAPHQSFTRGKQAKQLRQERQQNAALVADSKGSTTFAPALAPSSSSSSRQTCNAQRATCSWQWPPLWHKPNKWKLFKVCFGFWT